MYGAYKMAYEEYVRKIEFFIKNLPKRMYEPVGALAFEGFFTYDRLSLQEANARAKKPLPKGTEWGKKWEYGWFFTKLIIPKVGEGKKIIFEGKQGESVVFVNGRAAGAFDKEHTHITLSDSARAGEVFEIAMEAYAGHDGTDPMMERDKVDLVLPETGISEFPANITQQTVTGGSFGIFYDEVFLLWMDIKTLYDLRNNLDDASLRKAKIDKALRRMCDSVDIELPMEEFLAALKGGRERLRPELECKNGSTAPTIYAVGHSHLDLEWLWTAEETRRKCARTLGNQLKLIEEYPEYKYIQSQPWILETVKNEYPELYKEVKKAVSSGDIIVEGGTWVEPDTNIPSGESLIRQFMLGKKFIKEEFGKDSEIFWLPDSFGMTGALPQIMRGCGIKYFMNAKIMWQYNGGDELPHSNFWWQGIDGSEILTLLTQEYATELTPSKVFEKWNLNREKAEVPVTLLAYGHGDGGGGATRIHLEYLKREKDLEGMPKVVPASPNKFFKALENDCEITEKYVGELYYAAHRGTYTTQAMTKKLNRKSEFALKAAEMWSALLEKHTKAETDALWKTVLFRQFHDILPGTSITRVYEETEKELTEVIKKANMITDAALTFVVEENSSYITVFNPLSKARKAMVELTSDYTSMDGCETQKIGSRIVAQVLVPACGYKSYKLGREKAEEENYDHSLVLENNRIKAELNENGELISLTDKKTNMEFLSKPSNVFRMYQDMSMFFDAWDIDSFYEKSEIRMENKAEVHAAYKGKLESCIVIKKKINNSTLTQRVILRKDSRAIEFETEIDWRETHRLLKVDFNTNIRTEELVSEVQYGYVKRPNHRSRPYDADRFEVCNHKWSALAESRRGVAILNDCKYGISADGSRMSLTLLRSTVNPARFADKGVHKFTYAVMPFTENFADCDVVDVSYELNCPVTIKKGYAGEMNFLAVSENNIIIDTVKPAENGSEDFVVRMYEAKNTYTPCKLRFGFDVKEAYIGNMLEQNPVKVEVKANEIALNFNPFEVITVIAKREGNSF